MMTTMTHFIQRIHGFSIGSLGRSLLLGTALSTLMAGCAHSRINREMKLEAQQAALKTLLSEPPREEDRNDAGEPGETPVPEQIVEWVAASSLPQTRALASRRPFDTGDADTPQAGGEEQRPQSPDALKASDNTASEDTASGDTSPEPNASLQDLGLQPASSTRPEHRGEEAVERATSIDTPPADALIRQDAILSNVETILGGYRSPSLAASVEHLARAIDEKRWADLLEARLADKQRLMDKMDEDIRALKGRTRDPSKETKGARGPGAMAEEAPDLSRQDGERDEPGPRIDGRQEGGRAEPASRSQAKHSSSGGAGNAYHASSTSLERVVEQALTNNQRIMEKLLTRLDAMDSRARAERTPVERAPSSEVLELKWRMRELERELREARTSQKVTDTQRSGFHAPADDTSPRNGDMGRSSRENTSKGHANTGERKEPPSSSAVREEGSTTGGREPLSTSNERDERRLLQERIASLEEQRSAIEKRAQNQSLDQKDGTQGEDFKKEADRLTREIRELKKRQEDLERNFSQQKALLLDRLQPLVDSGVNVELVGGKFRVLLSSDVLFESGSADLSPQGKRTVTEVGNALKPFKSIRLQSVGHTDSVPIKGGRFKSNFELAYYRAQSVMDALIEAGFPPERLSAASYGSTRPIASNDTEEGRRKNRRIELVIEFD